MVDLAELDYIGDFGNYEGWSTFRGQIWQADAKDLKPSCLVKINGKEQVLVALIPLGGGPVFEAIVVTRFGWCY